MLCEWLQRHSPSPSLCLLLLVSICSIPPLADAKKVARRKSGRRGKGVERGQKKEGGFKNIKDDAGPDDSGPRPDGDRWKSRKARRMETRSKQAKQRKFERNQYVNALGRNSRIAYWSKLCAKAADKRKRLQKGIKPRRRRRNETKPDVNEKKLVECADSPADSKEGGSALCDDAGEVSSLCDDAGDISSSSCDGHSDAAAGCGSNCDSCSQEELDFDTINAIDSNAQESMQNFTDINELLTSHGLQLSQNSQSGMATGNERGAENRVKKSAEKIATPAGVTEVPPSSSNEKKTGGRKESSVACEAGPLGGIQPVAFREVYWSRRAEQTQNRKPKRSRNNRGGSSSARTSRTRFSARDDGDRDRDSR